MSSRALTWDGCCNVRDLGGLLIEGGGETRCGVVVRADDVSLLSGAGWKALEEYGVGSVRDFLVEAGADGGLLDAFAERLRG